MDLRSRVGLFVSVSVVAGVLAVVGVSGPASGSVSGPYAPGVMAQSPLAYWRLGDPASASPGTLTNEVSGSPLSLQSSSSVTLGALGADPGDGSAYMSGADAHRLTSTVGASARSQLASATVSVVVKLDAYPEAGKAAVIVGAEDQAGWPLWNRGLSLGVNDKGQLFAYAGQGNGTSAPEASVVTKKSLRKGRFLNIVSAYNAATGLLRVYVNNERVGSSQAATAGALAWTWGPGENPNNSTIEFGQHPNYGSSSFPGYGLTGAIDEISLFGRALSTADIDAMGSGLPTNWHGPLLLDRPDPSVICSCTNFAAGDPIDTASGNFYESLPGVSVPGRGVGLSFGLMSNSSSVGTTGAAGPGWSSVLDMAVEAGADGTWVVRSDSGAGIPFWPGYGGWFGPANLNATLSVDAGGFTFVRNSFERFRFDTAGRLVEMSDLRSPSVTTVHYPSGTSTRADWMEDSAGRRLSFGWQSSPARLTSVTDPYAEAGGPRVITLGYDGNGNLTDYVDTNRGHWVLGYDGSHRLSSVQRPSQFGASSPKAAVTEYDSAGRAWRQTDQLGRQTVITYSYSDSWTTAQGGTWVRVQYKAASGAVASTTVTQFNEAGQRVRTIGGYGTAAQNSTTYSFSADTATTTSVVDNAGKATISTTDPDTGMTTSVTDPTGYRTTFTYNSFDQVLATTGGIRVSGGTVDTSHQVVDENTYDAGGRLTQATVAKGTGDQAVTQYIHGDGTHPEDVTSVIDARGKTWYAAYDGPTGLQTSAKDPLLHETKTTYNSVGWPLTVTSPKGVATTTVAHDYETTYAYDLVNRTTTVTDPVGVSTVTTLDADGLTASATTGTDTTGFDHDAAGQVTVEHLPGGATRSHGYDALGNETSYTNEKGDAWGYLFDEVGHLKTSTDPKNRVESYGYDPAGRLAWVQQASSGANCAASPRVGCVSYAYDDAGRPTGVDYSDGSTPDVTGITYDDLGRRTDATRAAAGGVAAATEHWVWNARSQLTSHTDVNGRVTGYGWDATGNLTSVAYPDSAGTVTRNFDDAGRFTSILDWSGRTTTFGYDDDSNWTSTVFPKPGGTANTDVFGYDMAGRMTSAVWRQGTVSGTVLGSETYTRPTSKKGMIDTTAMAGVAGTGSKTNTYDGRDRLTAAGTESFTLDGASNLTKGPGGRLQVFDPAQQLCWTSATATSGTCATPPADATTYSYDERGNRTGMQPASGVGSIYGFDQANRMTSAKVPSTGGDGQLTNVTATRLLDTRTGVGSCTPGPCARLTGGTSVDVAIAGQGPVPATDIAAVWATVTVVNPAASGNLRLDPTGGAAAVTLDYTAGADRNTTAIVPVGVDGKITALASTAVDLVIDTSGYFKTAESAADTYRNVSPTRIVDTRNGTGTCNGVPCATPGAGATTLVTVAGQGGLPATGVHDAVVSVTAVSPATTGQLTVAPGTGGAAAATLNYSAGHATNEMVIAPVDANGKVTIVTSTAQDFVIDVSGYFTPPTATNLGLGVHNLTPVRLVDAATGTGPCVGSACGPLVASTRQKVQITGNAGVPASATGVVGTFTVAPAAADGFVRLNPNFTSGMGLAGDETINYVAGATRNATVLLPLKSDGTIEVVASNNAGNWTLDISGYLTQPAGTWTYRYDTAGTRSAKISPDGTTTQFAHSSAPGLPMLLEQVTGTTKTFIIYGPGDQPVEQINPDGTTWWLHRDQLGSVRLATLSTTGATVSSRTFNAYGTVKAQSGTQPLLGYNGQYHDTETGFLFLRARYAEPLTGQFVTLDPLASVTRDPYGYAGGNPQTGVDPSGLDVLGVCTSQWITAFIVQFGHENCYVEDEQGGNAVTDSWGGGFMAIGLGAGISGGAYYSNVDSVDDLGGVDTCASVAVGGGFQGYAQVCVGDSNAYSVEFGAGWELGFDFKMTGGMAFSANITTVRANLRCKRRATKEQEKENARKRRVDALPYVDRSTPGDGQSAGTPGGASPGRPDITGPHF